MNQRDIDLTSRPLHLFLPHGEFPLIGCVVDSHLQVVKVISDAETKSVHFFEAFEEKMLGAYFNSLLSKLDYVSTIQFLLATTGNTIDIRVALAVIWSPVTYSVLSKINKWLLLPKRRLTVIIRQMVKPLQCYTANE